MSVTIREAIQQLTDMAENKANPLGDEAVLTLSLTESELDVVGVDEIHLEISGDGACAEIRVKHPDLCEKSP